MTSSLSTPELMILGGLAVAIVAVGCLIAFRVRDHLAEARLRTAAARNRVLRDLLGHLESTPSLKVRRVLARREFLEDIDRVARWIERTHSPETPDALPEPFPDAKLVDRYLVQIRRGNDELARAAAAGLLGWTASPRVVAPLLATAEIANRRSPELRKMALLSLSRVRHPDTIRHLLTALEKADPDLLELLVSVCAQMGSPIVDPVAAALADPASSPALRAGCARILGGIEHHRAIPPLVAALADRDAEVRAEVTASLGWTRDAQVTDRLAELMLTDPVPLVRSAAARTLGQSSPDRAVRTLARSLSDPRAETRVRVIEGLEQLGVIARDVLIVALADPDRGVSRGAARALQGIGAIDEAIGSLTKEGYDAAATEFLIEIGRSGHLEPILDALQGASAELDQEIVRILGRIGDPRAGEALAGLLDDDARAPIHARAVDALRRISDPTQVPRVLLRLTARDEWLRKAAVDYLAKFGGPDVAENVVPLLADPNPWTRTSALKVLEVLAAHGFETGHVRELLSDPYDFVRAQAIRTLSAAHAFELLLDDEVMDHIAEDRIRNALLRSLGDHATVVAMPLITRLTSFCSDRDLDLLRYAARRALNGLEASDVDLLLLGYADPDEETSARWFASIAWPRASENAAAVWRDELLTDPDPRVRSGMVAALSERDEPRADLIVAVHRALDDPAPIVVRAGLATAGRRSLHELDAAVSDALGHAEESVRVDATFVQGLLDGSAARADSLALSKGSRAERVAAAAARLVLNDPAAVVDWISHLRMGSDRRIVEGWILSEHPLFRFLRSMARERHDAVPAQVLLCRSAFEAEEYLAHVLGSSLRDSDRLLALRAMISAGSDRCLGYIRGAFFRDSAAAVRADALAYLVERNPFNQRRDYLEIALEDGNDTVRVRATRLLGLLHAPEAASLLAERLGTGTRAERAAVIERLAVLVQDSGEELLDHILHPDRTPEALADLARVLDRCSLPISVDVLESLFEHHEPIVRLAALRPLFRRLGDQGWSLVDRGLRDSSSKVRGRTVQALGSDDASALLSDPERLRQVLRLAHTDRDPEVRSRTALAVANLGLDGTAGILGSLERDDDPRVERIARQARVQLQKKNRTAPV